MQQLLLEPDRSIQRAFSVLVGFGITLIFSTVVVSLCAGKRKKRNSKKSNQKPQNAKTAPAPASSGLVKDDPDSEKLMDRCFGKRMRKSTDKISSATPSNVTDTPSKQSQDSSLFFKTARSSGQDMDSGLYSSNISENWLPLKPFKPRVDKTPTKPTTLSTTMTSIESMEKLSAPNAKTPVAPKENLSLHSAKTAVAPPKKLPTTPSKTPTVPKEIPSSQRSPLGAAAAPPSPKVFTADGLDKTQCLEPPQLSRSDSSDTPQSETLSSRKSSARNDERDVVGHPRLAEERSIKKSRFLLDKESPEHAEYDQPEEMSDLESEMGTERSETDHEQK